MDIGDDNRDKEYHEEIKDPKDRYYDGWQIPVPLGVVKGSFTNMHYYDSDWGWGHGVSSYHSLSRQRNSK